MSHPFARTSRRQLNRPGAGSGLRQAAIATLLAGLPVLTAAQHAAPDAARRSEAPTQLSPIEVRAKTETLQDQAASGSEGIVSGQRLLSVPLLRPGEVLELIPGLIVTQHAGDGKANQYFLRGFNLDHGTDFAVFVAGVPVNMPSHAHGQGYTDLNFLIPELVDRIAFRKGTYFAGDGDFASAGSARIDYVRSLEGTLAQLTVGANGYARTLLAGSPAWGRGHLLYALDVFHNNGPWQIPEDYRKLNAVLRYSEGTRTDGLSVTAMAYRGSWTSTDQIPQRSIDSGQLSRFDSLDPSSGGQSSRYSLSAEWAGRGKNTQTVANAWALQSGLDLWSNFQYCLNDLASSGGCTTGDQFRQTERRVAAGFSGSHAVYSKWQGLDTVVTIGLHGRADRLSPVGLYSTSQRTTLATVREDRVSQRSLSLWGQAEVLWSEQLRTLIGLRADRFDFSVDSSLSANSGTATDHLLTPKLALIYKPANNLKMYLNYGQGFHSNDARGTTISVDPSNPANPADKVPPLVRTKGYEVGMRAEILPGWHSTLSLWQLSSASELLFVGDAGTTEPSRPSRRYGLEWANFIRLTKWLTLDADLSLSHARFRDNAPEGNFIPGAVTSTANLGIAVDGPGAWYGAARLRYFGPRPLLEDNSVRSQASALVNLRAGYKISARTRVVLDIYNLFNRPVNDIEYAYLSQRAGEPAPVFDRHLHPSEPRSLRLTLSHRF